MSKLVLLISDNPQDLAFAQEITQQVNLTLKHVSNSQNAAQVIENEEIASIIVDGSTVEQYEAFEQMIQNTVGLFSDKINPNVTHYISSNSLDKSTYLLLSPIFGHFILRDFNDVGASAELYGRVLKASLEADSSGLSRFLKPSTKIHSIQLTHSTQKLKAIEATKNFLLAAKFQNRISTIVCNAVDELLMNAIFGAPIDDSGRPILSTSSRASSLVLEGRNLVEMSIGFDGEFLGICIRDQYGSLDKDKLLALESKNYSEQEYKPRAGAVGAGLGLATIFLLGGSLHFTCVQRDRTEVVVFFRKTDNFKEFKTQFRFMSTQFYF